MVGDGAGISGNARARGAERAYRSGGRLGRNRAPRQEHGTGTGALGRTRQQLSFTEYYTLWRDDRVRDAGMVSDNVEGVALYDKQGHIVAPARPDRPMLASLPGQAPLALLQQKNGGSHFSIFLPVHADPDGRILLGYVGVKFNFAAELRRARAYQFADLAASARDLGGRQFGQSGAGD